MSRQFSFYLTPLDLSALEQKIRESVAMEVLAEESSVSKPSKLADLRISKMGRDNLAVYLANPNDMSKVRMEKPNKLETWYVDVLLSPVIEVTRSYLKGNTFRAGRMYYTTGFYDDRDLWEDKTKEFLEWAQLVFMISKRNLNRNDELDAYLGEEADRLLDSGQIEFSKT